MRYSILFPVVLCAWLSGCALVAVPFAVADALLPTTKTKATKTTTMKSPAVPEATPRRLQTYSQGFCFGPQKSKDRPDYVALLAQNRSRAEAGDAKAGFCLGYMYSKSLGTFKDDGQVAPWVNKAAGQGLAEAQYRLALSVGAVDNQGHARIDFTAGPFAQFDRYGRPVGRFSRDPQGYSDAMQAAQWLEKAAAQGYADAQYELAILLDRSCGLIDGCDSDNPAIVARKEQSRQWWDKAIEQGYVLAISVKAERVKSTDKVEAARLYCRAMQQAYSTLYEERPIFAAHISGGRLVKNEGTANAEYDQRLLQDILPHCEDGCRYSDKGYLRSLRSLRALQATEPSAPWPECKVWQD